MPDKQTIIILGGGFGGVYTARHLERKLRRSGDVEIILVNRHNYFLMTPLLFEAGSGVLEPRHAVSPIRKLFRSARFVQAKVTNVDFDRQIVTASPGGTTEVYELKYTHLVIALGGVTNTHIVPGAEKAMTFKVLADAIFLRNHAIEQFERADIEKDATIRKRLLTFIIAGGGLVGMELVGELSDFLLSLTKSYKRIRPEDLHIELIEGGAHLMKEMDTDLGDYAKRVLEKRGVKFRTNTRAERIDQHPNFHYTIHLAGGETIDAATLIASMGVAANPLLENFPLEKERKGRLLTDATMLCRNRKNVWAIGDCASIPDPAGKPYPQLAQHALREAKVLSDNLVSTLNGTPLRPFVFEQLGSLAALGSYKGVGTIKGIHIRGFIAWWVWRTYYLLQMPRISRRIRIMIDWTSALFFKNDIVELNFWESPMACRTPTEEKSGSSPADPSPGWSEPQVEKLA